MKKFYKYLIGIFVFIFGLFFGGIISYCNATDPSLNILVTEGNAVILRAVGANEPVQSTFGSCFRINPNRCAEGGIGIYKTGYEEFFIDSFNTHTLICGYSSDMIIKNYNDSSCTLYFYSGVNISNGSCSGSGPSTIDVLYNNENSTSTVTCDGDNIIQIDGLSTLTSTNKRTPYFNINYRDEDNQLLTESYSKNNLYLSGGLFKKTYTGNNERILTNQNNNSESSFSGYIPTFDVVFTGDSREDTGNVFNNFAENSLNMVLSNIPSYIQYVIIIMLLFFILGLARRKKRR